MFEIPAHIAEQVEDLNLAAIDSKPINVDGWDFSDYDNSDREVTYTEATVMSGDDRDWTVVFSSANSPRIEINGHLYYENGYDEYAEYEYDEPVIDEETFAEIFAQIDNGAVSAEGPMMNYWYPVHINDEDQAAIKLAGTSLCVVNVDGQTGLALTGGGMDMTWDVCEAFIALGMLPPVHFGDLPGMAGVGSERDLTIVAACLRSYKVMAERLTYQRERLADNAKRWFADK